MSLPKLIDRTQKARKTQNFKEYENKSSLCLNLSHNIASSFYISHCKNIKASKSKRNYHSIPLTTINIESLKSTKENKLLISDCNQSSITIYENKKIRNELNKIAQLRRYDNHRDAQQF